jgi:hypothetical protein
MSVPFATIMLNDRIPVAFSLRAVRAMPDSQPRALSPRSMRCVPRARSSVSRRAQLRTLLRRPMPRRSVATFTKPLTGNPSTTIAGQLDVGRQAVDAPKTDRRPTAACLYVSALQRRMRSEVPKSRQIGDGMPGS